MQPRRDLAGFLVHQPHRRRWTDTRSARDDHPRRGCGLPVQLQRNVLDPGQFGWRRRLPARRDHQPFAAGRSGDEPDRERRLRPVRPDQGDHDRGGIRLARLAMSEHIYPDPVQPRTADDLQKITGIGPVLAKRLRAAGVTSYRDLATIPAERIAELLGGGGGISVERITDQARRLADNATMNPPDHQRYATFHVELLIDSD